MRLLNSTIQSGGFTWTTGKGTVLATAIHNGHSVRPEVLECLALDENERLREEDPFTGDWTDLSAHRLIVERSRFECDLNRPRKEAIYVGPKAAWGLDLYREPLTKEIRTRSLEFYDDFYQSVETFITSQLERQSHFLVIDLHSYNHRRNGPDSKPADAATNPEINLGTLHITPAEYWMELVEIFESTLRSYDLDVKHNVPFEGGHFPQWLNRKWLGRVCALTVEVKKVFMDEWTGLRDNSEFLHIGIALKKATQAAEQKLISLS